MRRTLTALLTAAFAAALVATYACGDDDDGGADSTPTIDATPADTRITYATPVPPPPGGAAPVEPIPEIAEPSIDTGNWQEFTHSTGLATVSFPAEWQTSGDRLFSWDLGTATPLPAVSVEEGGLLIQVSVTPLENYERRPATASDFTIPAGSGWQTDYQYDTTVSGNVLRIHEVGIPLGDQAIFLTGYLSDESQEETFAAIVWSLQVTSE